MFGEKCADAEQDRRGLERCIDVAGDDATELFIAVQDDVPIELSQRYLIADPPDWAQSLAVADIPAASAGTPRAALSRSPPR